MRASRAFLTWFEKRRRLGFDDRGGAWNVALMLESPLRAYVHLVARGNSGTTLRSCLVLPSRAFERAGVADQVRACRLYETTKITLLQW
jgi:hypothetical protein